MNVSRCNMNFIRKKLKPAGFSQHQNKNSSSSSNKNNNRDLEDDLYDEYVVEAPPHPSELIALGVDPSEIDVNDPDKLRDIYKRATQEGKHTKTNSVLLARQRQKEAIEERKRTGEEWKFFDSLTSRVEQVVKESQKNLEQWKESSAVSELTKPEYELRQTVDEVFRAVSTVKAEKVGESDWIDFDESDDKEKKAARADSNTRLEEKQDKGQELDEFGCPRAGKELIVEEILRDTFGPPSPLPSEQQQPPQVASSTTASSADQVADQASKFIDPFDTSYVKLD